MDGGKTRGRTYRQRIIEVLSNYWELTRNQRSSELIPSRITSFAGVDIIQQFESGNLSIKSWGLCHRLSLQRRMLTSKYDVHYIIFKLSYPVARERIGNKSSSKEMSILISFQLQP